MSHVAAPEVPLVQVDVSADNPEEFGGGLYDISMLPLYADHVARHVWDGELKVFCVYYLKHMCYNILTF